jgi:RNA polymerase sigma factor (sigma-70 family)
MTRDITPAPGSPTRVPAREERRQRLALLLEGAVAGRREDLDGIVVELTPLLWHVARAQGVDRATCEDVVQTAWLTLLKHLGSIHTPQALTAWLVTVTKREALRLRRSNDREESTTDDVLETLTGTASAVDAPLLADEQQAVLWRLIGELPPRCRELIRVIAYTDRPSYEAISQALGMPHGSIGPTRGRCLAKLRFLLLSSPEWSWP